MVRVNTLSGQLARRGFGDPHHAVTVIESWFAVFDDEEWALFQASADALRQVATDLGH